ncbi:MAG: TetR/AcrR family transcriptional regulator [Oscillospiraceae bacterium]|nr:TetR/AcrR family transcriptional regulator [Oscillospiraceae bacterium]
MANVKDNRRVQYTKTALKKSLLVLLKEKPVDRITVKELCAGADLNRGTFYTYYSSPMELLEEIENDFYVDILLSVTAFRKADDIVSIFEEAVAALRQRRELSEALFGKNGDDAFLQKLVDVARETCLTHWRRLVPEAGETKLNMMYDFCSYGCMKVVREWLQAGAKEEPRVVAQFLTDICNRGLLPLLGRK